MNLGGRDRGFLSQSRFVVIGKITVVFFLLQWGERVKSPKKVKGLQQKENEI